VQSARQVAKLLGQPIGDASVVFDATRIDGRISAVVDRYNAKLDALHVQQLPHLDARALPLGLKQDHLLHELSLARQQVLMRSQAPGDVARMRSCANAASFAWLTAVPNGSYGTAMMPEQFRTAVLFRLGNILVPPNARCESLSAAGVRCDQPLDAAGVHATTCRIANHKFTRHNALAVLVGSLCREGGLTVSTEPLHLLNSNNGQRPADLHIRGLDGARPRALDVSVINPACQSHVVLAARAPLEAARKRDAEKQRKYLASCRAAGIVFMPFSVESYGALSPVARVFVKRLISLRCARDPFDVDLLVSLQRRYFLQRFSVLLQTHNADAIRACMNRSVSAQLARIAELDDPPIILPTSREELSV
jgi:hypothetical protein